MKTSAKPLKLTPLSQKKLCRKLEKRLAHGVSTTLFTPNLEMLVRSSEDKALRTLLNSANIRLPDGIGIYLCALFGGMRPPARTTGIDCAEALLSLAEKRGYSVFLLGGRQGVARRAATKLRRRYRALKVVGTHHGYFDKRQGADENNSVIRSINEARPDVLFVCFGFPLQERWISENISSLPSVKLAMGLGGSLDVWSGDVRRAPKAFRNAGLEWLWRIAREPKRLLRVRRGAE